MLAILAASSSGVWPLLIGSLLAAVIAAAAAVMSPLLVAGRIEKQRLKEKASDNARHEAEKAEADLKRREERLSDFERTQEVARLAQEVAARAETARLELIAANKVTAEEAIRQQRAVADEAIRQQEVVATRLETSNMETAATAEAAAAITNGKLDDIHVLVNSQMLEQIVAQHDTEVSNLTLMKEIIELKKASGIEPSEATEAALIAKQAKIDELAAQVVKRKSQAAQVAEAEEARGEDPSAQKSNRESRCKEAT
jgi:hypothetical protein